MYHMHSFRKSGKKVEKIIIYSLLFNLFEAVYYSYKIHRNMSILILFEHATCNVDRVPVYETKKLRTYLVTTFSNHMLNL